MIDFRCPDCRTELEAADDRAGVRVPCPACGRTITVPPPVRVAKVAAPAPAEQPTPQTTGWAVRCYQCGAVIDAAEARRRDVLATKGGAFAGSPFDLSNWIFGGAPSRVDLCADCAARHDARVRLVGGVVGWGLAAVGLLLILAVLYLMLRQAVLGY